MKLTQEIIPGRDQEGSAFGNRNAYHLAAVVSETNDSSVRPGDRVVFVDGGKVVPSNNTDYHGVVDPFLDDGGSGCDGMAFLVFLAPGHVTGLTHHFNAPFLEAEKTYGDGFEDGKEEAEYDECRGCC